MPSGNKLVGICNRMGKRFASKFNGTSMVKIMSFELVKVEFSITGPTNTQEDGLVSSQYLFSIKCTCCWFAFSLCGCLIRLAMQDLCGVPCILHSVSREKKEKKKKRKIFVERGEGVELCSMRSTAGGIWWLCCASISSLPVSVLTKPAPKGLLL
eukprot:1160355-Pelagomonas_calceolata.AAC.1